MKKTKVFLTVVCAVLLIAASVMGTLAYLTSTDTVTNTFTVGQVKIKLDEANVGDDGKALTGDAAERVQENSYVLMPGHTYDKDPTVTVLKGSEASYIKLVVTVNKTAELDKLFSAHKLSLAKMVTGYDSETWKLQKAGGEQDANGNRTYTFYYKETVSAKNSDVKLDPLFKQIVIPGELTNDEMKSLQYKITKNDDDTETVVKDPLTITVNAYAIQADGFASAEAAWAAYSASNS